MVGAIAHLVRLNVPQRANQNSQNTVTGGSPNQIVEGHPVPNSGQNSAVNVPAGGATGGARNGIAGLRNTENGMLVFVDVGDCHRGTTLLESMTRA